MKETTRKTIHLSGRRPVSINETEWPILASAVGDSWEGTSSRRHHLAITGHKVDVYRVLVLHNEDGRTIVYSEVVATDSRWCEPANGHDCYAGQLLECHKNVDHADAIEQSIRWVCEQGNIPPRVMQSCIQNLPPENL